MKNRWLLFMTVLILSVLSFPFMVSAKEAGDNYFKALSEEMDYGELDSFLKDTDIGELSFSGLVEELMEGENGREGIEKTVSWMKNALVNEIETSRVLLLEIVVMAFGFSVLKNFAGAFHSSYVSDLCFLLVYCAMAVLLLKTFILFQGIVSQALTNCVEFMKVLVPTFCLSMMFASNAGSAAGFYQLAFLVIYLVEWLFLNFLMPLIHIYILLEVFGHIVPEEKFSNLTELFSLVIQWGMKISGVIVLGLNVVQNLIGPAKDRIGQGVLKKAATALPGIGNAVGSVTELLLGAGIMIQSCVGAAGLIVLILIGLIPLLKAVCLAFFYKLAAAVTEPVTDKRISGCLRGMANGGVLYVKLLGYCILLFFVTIALTAAASAYIY